jgi:hypothetical protein
MARPKKDIDLAVVKRMATHQCSNVEIAAAVGCDESTIRARFPDELASWRELGKTHLRDMQWRSACKGNVPMQIFLGKQCLGQSEHVTAEVEVTAKPVNPLELYADHPDLLERQLQLEEDITNASSADAATLPFQPGASRHSGLGLPTAPSAPPAGGNGTPHESDGQPPGD